MNKNQEHIEKENTVEEEIEPISEEQEAPVLQEPQEQICIRLRIPINEESSERVLVGGKYKKQKNKPQGEWEISTNAPKDINANISQENIIERQSCTNQALTVDVGEEAAKQKDKAFYKNKKIISTAMNTQTELNEGNPDNLKEARGRNYWLKWKESHFSELDYISD
ncbi:hypothetical protein O181_006611 [Austropuccinia psidii MF-1]|uniref:Uncharacterized protein n=1 Tax=Austropuccinia psidii MF-1 TaxID=1389203 RepID=A0A9Q3BL78_9BASI|nr:hypothetical protein [Austropuccinia psidii MF-1]